MRNSHTANASLNMYRRKFKQAKEKIIKNNIDKDNKLFFDDSVLNKKWVDTYKCLTDCLLIYLWINCKKNQQKEQKSAETTSLIPKNNLFGCPSNFMGDINIFMFNL